MKIAQDLVLGSIDKLEIAVDGLFAVAKALIGG